MLRIDWSGWRPPARTRRYVETRVAACAHADDLLISVARRGSELEAYFRVSDIEDAATLRLRDGDVGRLVDRLLALLDILAHARAQAIG